MDVDGRINAHTDEKTAAKAEFHEHNCGFLNN